MISHDTTFPFSILGSWIGGSMRERCAIIYIVLLVSRALSVSCQLGRALMSLYIQPSLPKLFNGSSLERSRI